MNDALGHFPAHQPFSHNHSDSTSQLDVGTAQLNLGTAQLNRSIIASTPLYLSQLFSTRPHVDVASGNGVGDRHNSHVTTTTSTSEPPTLSSSADLIPPPQHLFGDYVEMIYLGLVIVAGTAINAFVLHKLLRERRRKVFGKNSKGFILLKINLNLSDLLILVIHALGKLIWLAEYEWRFGEALCRAFNFLSMFTLYLSSNIVVCIAMDRLRTVVQARKPTVSRKQSVIRLMVLMAWILAFLWSLPQLYFWRTLNVFPEYPGGWIQCSDIWSIERHELMRNANHKPLNSIFISNFVQNLYDLTHLCFVFYGPLVLLIICYFFILIRLLRFAKSTTATATTTVTANMEVEKGNFETTDSPIYSTYQTSILDLSKDERANFFRRCRDFFADCIWSRIWRVKREFSTRSSRQERKVTTFSDSVLRNIDVSHYKSNNHRTQSLVESSELELAAKRESLRLNRTQVNSSNAIDKIHNNKHSVKRSNNDNETISITGNGHVIRQTRAHKHNSQNNKHSSHNNYGYARNNNSNNNNNDSRLANGANWRNDAESEKFQSNSTLNNNNNHVNNKFNKNNNNNNSSKTNVGGTPREKIPLWRRQMKSRVFRTTLLVIVTHVLLWLPYNSYALMKYINLDLYMRMNEKANVLKDLQFLITIINPFLYGFSQQ